MNRVALLFLLLGLTGVASANTISLGGLDVAPPAITVISFNNTDPAAVSSLTFDFTYVSQAPSWSEDLIMQVTHEPSGTSVRLGAFSPFFPLFGIDYCDDIFGAPCDYELGGSLDSNPLTVTDLVVPFVVASGAGLWTVEIADGLDDMPVFDGAFEDGSEITINTTVVPVPAAAWLFASALLGLGGLRRRR